jgi:hypothetical protein
MMWKLVRVKERVLQSKLPRSNHLHTPGHCNGISPIGIDIEKTSVEDACYLGALVGFWHMNCGVPVLLLDPFLRKRFIAIATRRGANGVINSLVA